MRVTDWEDSVVFLVFEETFAGHTGYGGRKVLFKWSVLVISATVPVFLFGRSRIRNSGCQPLYSVNTHLSRSLLPKRSVCCESARQHQG